MKRDRKVMYYLLLQVRDEKPALELAGYPEDVKVYNASGLTSRGHDLLEKMEAEFNSPASQSENLNRLPLALFISHSSKDIELAEAMIELMRLGIGLTEE